MSEAQIRLRENLAASQREFNGKEVLDEYRSNTNLKAAKAYARRNCTPDMYSRLYPTDYKDDFSKAVDRLINGKPFEVSFDTDTVDSVYEKANKVRAGLSESIPTQKRADAENELVKEGFTPEQASDAGYTLDRNAQPEIQQRATERKSIEGQIYKEIGLDYSA